MTAPSPTPDAALTEEQVAEIRARVDAATEGPWFGAAGGLHVFGAIPGDEVAKCNRRPDATFVKHARTDVPALLADRARLTERLAEARGDRPSGFWSQREWEDWSNELAMLLPDDVEGWPGVNPEGAQESIIEAAIKHLLAEHALPGDAPHTWDPDSPCACDSPTTCPATPSDPPQGEGVERCPECRHAPHGSVGFCPNMASDNDCSCTYRDPAPASADTGLSEAERGDLRAVVERVRDVADMLARRAEVFNDHLTGGNEIGDTYAIAERHLRAALAGAGAQDEARRRGGR